MSQFYTSGITSGGAGTVTGSITTTNATPTTILSFPLTANQAVGLSATIVAFGSATPSCLNGSLEGGGYRGSVGGAVNLPPEYINQNETHDLTTATFSIVSSGNNILIQVTGQAGLTLSWKIYCIFIYTT